MQQDVADLYIYEQEEYENINECMPSWFYWDKILN